MASFATQVQIRRGTDAENNAFTGAEGEVTMDLTEKTLRVHDGEKQGGTKIINENYYGLLDRKITNCILEIPQNIKLELAEDGILTLKAGSKVYFPDGSFVNINSDKTLTPRDYNQVYVVDRSGRPVQWALNGVYSGSTAPTAQQYMLWFDTTNNIIKRSYDTGSTWTGDYSFPIGIIGPDDNQNLAIKQVFNGFGFIGNSVFALPGIIGLTPNGRNKDGSLNNTRVVTSNVIVRTFQNTLSQNTALYISENYISTLKAPGNYNFETNYNMNGQNVFKACHIGTCQLTQGTVSNFMIKNTFSPVDYNDYKQLQGLDNNIDFFVENGADYLKLKGGTIFCGGNANVGLVTLPKAFASTQYIIVLGASGASWSNKTTTSFQMNGVRSDWFAIGKGA